MNRGEIWTVSGGPDYTGKPRPALIIQNHNFPTKDSVAVIPFSSDMTSASLLRICVDPSDGNGLRSSCHLMIDKITTVPIRKIGKHIGRIDDKILTDTSDLLLVFLGLLESNRFSSIQ
jgi:mRNA interferase MazF